MACLPTELVLKNLCFSPETGSTLTEKLADCYRQFDACTLNTAKHSVLRQTIFISAGTNSEYHQNKRKLISFAKHFFEVLPPTSIIAQYPDNGSLLVEITYIEGLYLGELTTKQSDVASWLVFRQNGIKMVVAAGLADNIETNSILQQSITAFELAQNILQEEEMEFSDIIRQWNYIEQITANANYNHSIGQHYQIFNDVRSKYYQKASFDHGFPAATGIGMDFGGINIDFMAVKTEYQNSVIGLKSPVQLDAYSYSSEVLAENNTMCDFCRTTPKFERAKVLITPESKWIFVSGTAAIKGQLSSGLQSVEQQTEMTIQNILSLISAENLSAHRIANVSEVNVSYLRAYIKYKDDLPLVKQICRKYFPLIPISFVVADICRPELLVEIEGQAVFSN